MAEPNLNQEKKSSLLSKIGTTCADIVRGYWYIFELVFIAICIERISGGHMTATLAIQLFVLMNIVIALFRIWVYWDLFYNTIQYVTLLILKMQGKLTHGNKRKPNKHKKRNTAIEQTAKDIR